MKIIIVGAGIAGLSTYLHLRKHLPHTHTITIYESHQPSSKLSSTSQTGTADPSSPFSTTHNLDTLSESTAIVGGGLGISPNGMRVLYDLDEELHDAVAGQGFPVDNFVFKGANGWTLGIAKTSDKLVRGDGEEVCVASSRHGLWEAIMKFVREGVVKYKKVVGIARDEQSGRTVITLTDAEGNEERDEADMLIGADGVKSVVRTALLGDDQRFKPTYTGLSGVGGFLRTPIPLSIVQPSSMVFGFGRNGFFGYSSGSPPSARSLMWWSTFETSQLPDPKKIDLTAVKAALLERHKHWKDPIVQDIISRAEVESIYPTWVLDELPHWGEEGIVLLGDAAHAMDPTTGQGASQAFEDSQTLSLLLKEVLEVGDTKPGFDGSEREKVNLAIKMFYDIRSPRVREIVERGKKLAGRKANVGVVAEYFMYFFLWMLNRFPSIGKAILGDVNRKLYTWSAREEIKKAIDQRTAAP
ncbi:FAD/NAD(P)-binding domain-containing protein [Lentithecium fluviatile CBS 122367]|uniref:FAD/NAD(P)-binding domain-containing protein n=1 Tax=Lentithecium fluviatile CBS 122367 TaxID=1168545 RepID=A0A6G1IK67_9PLEO|nr:FAD/NAD(P)-binding domain-containing protein [Lentithecium fluviatile CBS 122367]